jgi:large subunit ribosomal protein L15
MNLNNLTPAPGSVKKAKRIGRGQGSGRGGTSTRGHKGAGSRAGKKTKIGFEGGQMPLQRRIPKYGFKNINRLEYVPINLSDLQRLAEKHNESTFDHATFYKHGMVSKSDKVKILGKGNLSKALTIKAHAYSESAKTAIETAGGKIDIA